jgi:hypothetical protein
VKDEVLAEITGARIRARNEVGDEVKGVEAGIGDDDG